MTVSVLLFTIYTAWLSRRNIFLHQSPSALDSRYIDMLIVDCAAFIRHIVTCFLEFPPRMDGTGLSEEEQRVEMLHIFIARCPVTGACTGDTALNHNWDVPVPAAGRDDSVTRAPLLCQCSVFAPRLVSQIRANISNLSQHSSPPHPRV